MVLQTLKAQGLGPFETHPFDLHSFLCDRKVEQVTEEVHALQLSLDKFGSRCAAESGSGLGYPGGVVVCNA